MSPRNQATQLFRNAQEQIINALETVDGKSKFSTDRWTRPDKKGGDGGGGTTRILRRGAVFEQAGVSFSEVFGTLPKEMAHILTNLPNDAEFYACGVSLVIHPHSPMIPTTHANFRYLEVADRAWFGGGMDLTPYYFYPEDAEHFHRTIKETCDRFGPSLYPKFKADCDTYFYLPHRDETRGVGGIFYDYLGKEDPINFDSYVRFSQEISETFIPAYLPIVEKRMVESWDEAQKNFQLLRRGRYVEFNLLYDRGTLFGLRTQGRTESILMSLPPEVRWDYCFTPTPDSREAQLLDVLQNPRDWV